MNISYQEKSVQQPRTLGRDANGWPDPSDSVWRVIESNHADFSQGDLLLMLGTKYKGHAVINLSSKQIHSGQIDNGNGVRIVQDFTLNSVTLYVDNSARP